jgi:AcrR family transcriptional regulator
MTLKTNIVHEAQKLFSLNGFLGTGINDIIEASGTSKGGFYNHFSSKEDLFYAVLAESQNLWREKVLRSTADISSPTEKIIKILTNYKDLYLKDAENFPGGCIFITFSVELDDTRPQLVEEVYRGFEGFRAMLKRLLDKAIQLGELPEDLISDSTSEMLFSGMLGASVLYGVDKSAFTLDQSISPMIDYLNFLRSKQNLNINR